MPRYDSIMLHRLCERCQQLHFELHEAATCASLGCTLKAFKPLLSPLHSTLYEHYPSFEDLEISSHQGRCHLCSLIAAALRSKPNTNLSDLGRKNPPIKLAFECYTGGMHAVREHLIAVCGEVTAEFKVAIVPHTSCSDPGFLQTGTLYGASGVPDERQILFRAVYTGPEDNERRLYTGDVSLNKLLGHPQH